MPQTQTTTHALLCPSDEAVTLHTGMQQQDAEAAVQGVQVRGEVQQHQLPRARCAPLLCAPNRGFASPVRLLAAATAALCPWCRLQA